MKNTLLIGLSRFSSDSHTAVIGSGLFIHFRKSRHTNHLNGHLTETGTAGIVEAFYFDAVDIFVLFLGAIVDELIASNKIADITRMFTKYVDVVNLVYQLYSSPGWFENELQILFQ